MAENKRYGIVYDSNKCVGCQACTLACKSANSVPEKVYRLQVRVEQKGEFPALKGNYRRQSCVHCENAPCVSVCPTKASYVNKDGGVVLVDEKKCVGCKYCIVACPYDARFVNPETKVVDKCTFCWETKLANGEEPACVSTCMTGALVFGDLNDPDSEISKVLSEKYAAKPKEHLGTKPKVLTIPNRRGGDI